MRPKQSLSPQNSDPYRVSYINDEDSRNENNKIVNEKLSNLTRGLSGVDRMLKFSLISNILLFVVVIVIVSAGLAKGTRHGITSGGGAPIGTISAWTMKVTVSGVEVGDLPAGWQRCDGSTILEPSIWAGERTPDLNNERRFLRGGIDQDVLTMEEDMVIDHHHDVDDPGHNHPYTDKYYGDGSYWTFTANQNSKNKEYTDDDKTTSTRKTGIAVTGVKSGYRSGSETRPRNMNVIYIIRVW